MGGVPAITGGAQCRRPPSRELHDQSSRADSTPARTSCASITCSTSPRFRRSKSCTQRAHGRPRACATGRTRRERARRKRPLKSPQTASRFRCNSKQRRRERVRARADCRFSTGPATTPRRFPTAHDHRSRPRLRRSPHRLERHRASRPHRSDRRAALVPERADRLAAPQRSRNVRRPRRAASATRASAATNDASWGASSIVRASALSDLVARNAQTPLWVLLTVLAAFGLGALHGLEPGHGKALLAFTLVGARATFKQAVILAAALTFAHTIAVVLLGVLLCFAAGFATESLFTWITLVSGVAVAFIGARGLVATAVNRDRARAPTTHHAPSPRRRARPLARDPGLRAAALSQRGRRGDERRHRAVPGGNRRAAHRAAPASRRIRARADRHFQPRLGDRSQRAGPRRRARRGVARAALGVREADAQSRRSLTAGVISTIGAVHARARLGRARRSRRRAGRGRRRAPRASRSFAFLPALLSQRSAHRTLVIKETT